MDPIPKYYHKNYHTYYHKHYHNFYHNFYHKFDRSAHKKKKKKAATLLKSGHYPILRTLALCQDSSRDSTDELASAYDPEDEAASDSDPEDSTKSKGCLRRVDTIEEGKLSYFASVEEWKL